MARARHRASNQAKSRAKTRAKPARASGRLKAGAQASTQSRASARATSRGSAPLTTELLGIAPETSLREQSSNAPGPNPTTPLGLSAHHAPIEPLAVSELVQTRKRLEYYLGLKAQAERAARLAAAAAQTLRSVRSNRTAKRSRGPSRAAPSPLDKWIEIYASRLKRLEKQVAKLSSTSRSLLS